MTPLAIEILMHYHTRPGDYRDGDFSAPAVRELIDRFNGHDALLEASTDIRTSYRLSKRGEVCIEALQAIPLPVQAWIMPTTIPGVG
jgi:hypothetical protein